MKPEEIIVVSGLPRSGTSLMMQILQAAGVPPFTDNKRQADDSNPKGYYEHEKIAALLSSPDKSWIKNARGTAIKVIAPLLAGLPRTLKIPDSEPEPLRYRLLFMERDMEEILQSQSAMLQRLGKSHVGGAQAANIGKAYRQQERYAKSWCANRGIHAMSVSYGGLINCPDENLRHIVAFLGATSDKIAAMRGRIEPDLHRTRKSSHCRSIAVTGQA